jgi:tetratricopeptide (TPR) repeat protein
MNPTFFRVLAGFCLLLPMLGPVSARAGNGDGPDTALEPTLEGEFALQAGDYPRAAERYLQAATLSMDPALAQRATEIAVLTHQDLCAARALRRWRELSPQSTDAIGVAAVLALRRGDRDQARETLLGMLAGGGDGWKDAIRSLAAAADTPTATVVAGDLLERGHWPHEIGAWLALGGLAQRLGDPALTRRIVAEVVTRFPDDPRAWLLESARLREQGDTVGARRAIERALASPHGDSGLRTAAAAELSLLADPKAAAAALAHGPQNVATYTTRAAFLARADDRTGLQSLYREVKVDADKTGAIQSGSILSGAVESTSDRLLLLGQLADYLKRDIEALVWYRSVPRGKSHGEAISRSAMVLDRQGDTATALAQLHALQRDPDEDANAQRASYQLEAQLLAGHKRYDAALLTYARGLGVFDADPDLLYGRALLLEQMDRVADSEADLRGILQVDPDNAEALNALGYTLADRTQRYREAQGYIEKALLLQPDTPAFLDSLGWVQHHLGRDADAVRNLRRAFALQKDAEIAAHLGEVLWLEGDREDARGFWKQGQALDRDNRALKRVIDTYKP